MAKIVLGVGTSHSPMLSTPPEQWHLMGIEDEKAGYLVDPENGEPISYAELLSRRSGRQQVPDLEVFSAQWTACQHAIDTLSRTIKDVAPDVLIILSADQRELLFDDNMPMLQIYWGDTVRLVPRFIPENAPEVVRTWNWGYGDREMDLPIDSALGKHLIESLTEQEFDVAHSRYLRPDLMYGGEIGPAGYLSAKSVTPPKRQGIGHGWSFVIKRLLDNVPIPIVPVLQNATYPPNMPTPARCYKLGRALFDAVESWPGEKKVAVVTSGGLSHFVTDEFIDRLTIRGIFAQDDGLILSSLPRERLNSASAEIRNWITCAGACSRLRPELIDYVPVYRSAAGTGGGWAFMRWQ